MQGRPAHLPHASVSSGTASAERRVARPPGPHSRPGAGPHPIDSLVVAPDHDADRVTDALLEDVLRSASNKGCSAVEAGASADPAGLVRLERAGFAPAGPVLRRQLAAVGSIRRL